MEDINITEIVNQVFLKAVNEGASDIHFEPLKEKMIIRFRVDGLLRVVSEIEPNLISLIIAKIKILANLDTTGLPRAQEGKIRFVREAKEVDLRVSVFPTNLGECIVIRILESIKVFEDFKGLGFTQQQTEIINSVIEKPYGLILVTGPNGSGKSSTLFTMLHKLIKPEINVATLEDPVEREIFMARQTQINPEIGLTFASGLRYLLRQDPDIIMVGEIRDKETAQIAVEAAVTGHLVLATFHTNNAAGAVVRLVNMDIEPFLIASALKLITGQRLARQLCNDCKKKYDPPKELFKKIEDNQISNFYHTEGCEKCNQKGIKGRTGIHEVLKISKEMQELIFTNPSDEQINILAKSQGMINLRSMAMQKVNEGAISLEEALRITE